MFKRLLMALLALIPSACLPNGTPQQVVLSLGAHPAVPVLVESVRLNGAEMAGVEYVLSSGWADPKGDSEALMSLPGNSVQPDIMNIEAQWIDLFANARHTATLEVEIASLTVERLSQRTAFVTILLGPDGFLEVSTKSGPDAMGQYNGRVVATACGTRDTGLPADHWAFSNSRYLAAAEAPREMPPVTECRS